MYSIGKGHGTTYKFPGPSTADVGSKINGRVYICMHITEIRISHILEQTSHTKQKLSAYATRKPEQLENDDLKTQI